MIVQHSSQDQILNGCRLGVWVTGLMPTASGYESKQQQSAGCQVTSIQRSLDLTQIRRQKYLSTNVQISLW